MSDQQEEPAVYEKGLSHILCHAIPGESVTSNEIW